MKRFFAAAIILLTALSASANIRLPHLFTDNMVLQRDHTIPVWGWADKDEKISVRLNHQTKTVVADETGKWRLELAAEQAGGPFQLLVTGKNNITLNNILVGDVWVCSGQSNMEFSLQAVNDAATEIKY